MLGNISELKDNVVIALRYTIWSSFDDVREMEGLKGAEPTSAESISTFIHSRQDTRSCS